jgi:hypothetical protein
MSGSEKKIRVGGWALREAKKFSSETKSQCPDRNEDDRTY